MKILTGLYHVYLKHLEITQQWGNKLRTRAPGRYIWSHARLLFQTLQTLIKLLNAVDQHRNELLIAKPLARIAIILVGQYPSRKIINTDSRHRIFDLLGTQYVMDAAAFCLGHNIFEISTSTVFFLPI